MDFTDELPDLIVYEILSYLYIEDIKMMRYTTKKWNKLVSPLAFRALHYESYMERDPFHRLCTNFGNHITTLNFCHFRSELEPDHGFVEIIMKNCKNIRALSIEVDDHWLMAALLIFSLAVTQRNFNHLTLKNKVTVDFLRKISPVLQKIESFNLEPNPEVVV